MGNGLKVYLQDLKNLIGPDFSKYLRYWLDINSHHSSHLLFLNKMLNRTVFFMLWGDNLQGAMQLGVPINRVRIIAFAINGLMAAIAGIVFTSQIGFVPNSTGNGLEMKAIAACVLGGISLLGGAGNLIGAVLGAYFLIQIDSILVLLKVPAYWNNFVAGIVLLVVLVFDGRIES